MSVVKDAPPPTPPGTGAGTCAGCVATLCLPCVCWHVNGGRRCGARGLPTSCVVEFAVKPLGPLASHITPQDVTILVDDRVGGGGHGVVGMGWWLYLSGGGGGGTRVKVVPGW